MEIVLGMVALVMVVFWDGGGDGKICNSGGDSSVDDGGLCLPHLIWPP